MQYQAHLGLAHRYWTDLISPGDTVIDATCGNGHDTLVLARLALTPTSGAVYAIDLQEKAIETARKRAADALDPPLFGKIAWIVGSHIQFPSAICAQSVKLIAYNLGYLPQGDKNITTQTDSTIESVHAALALLVPGGALSMTCYPGHAEGAREEVAVLAFAKKLDPSQWTCCYHQWVNREKAPALLMIYRK